MEEALDLSSDRLLNNNIKFVNIQTCILNMFCGVNVTGLLQWKASDGNQLQGYHRNTF